MGIFVSGNVAGIANEEIGNDGIGSDDISSYGMQNKVSDLNCIDGVSLHHSEECRAENVVDNQSICDDAIGEVRRMHSGSDATKEVVLAFDSLKCSIVEVLDGASKSVEFFRVDDCFVNDEFVDVLYFVAAHEFIVARNICEFLRDV
ncbi:hypothetical protein L6452_02647 [Arctium lappa]|uniref:Uncharacterized protein n=1 Tax=Arctium lappa TaxID=4217 RepID=A0ACB9FJZ7_ARCLA|nr:hypothetical protein L6452_02647 [Arctium lappa]